MPPDSQCLRERAAGTHWKYQFAVRPLVDKLAERPRSPELALTGRGADLDALHAETR